MENNEIKFEIVDSKYKNINKVLKSSIIIKDTYLLINKEFYCNEFSEPTETTEDLFLNYVDVIFRDNITGISYNTVYNYPKVELEDVIWELVIVATLAQYAVDFKTEKECIEARDRILKWKLNR